MSKEKKGPVTTVSCYKDDLKFISKLRIDKDLNTNYEAVEHIINKYKQLRSGKDNESGSD